MPAPAVPTIERVHDAPWIDALLSMSVTDEQQAYVGRVPDLYAEAATRTDCEPCALLLDGQPIGGYCLETLARRLVGHDFDLPTLGLRGFFLDRRWQGRGLGLAAIDAMLADATHRHPQARQLILLVHECNLLALRMYRRAGFKDSGERYDGGRAGVQCLLQRRLP